MNVRYVFMWLPLIVAAFAITACNQVYDDLSGCLGNTITFSYLADDSKEHIQEYVDRIEVYIFDTKDESLVEKYHLEKEQLLSPLEIQLPEGQYRVVALGNALKETSITGSESYKNGLVSRPELLRKDLQSAGTFDKLYLGEQTITSRTMNEAHDVVRLYSQHLKIHAEVLPDGDADIQPWFEQNIKNGFRLEVEPLSARFSFTGTRSGITSFDLPFTAGEKKDRFVLDFNTLRFEDEDSILIYLVQNEAVLCTVDVAEYIAQYHKLIRITERQEAVLPLFFRQNSLSLSISVKPWEAIDVVPITD